MAIVNEKLAEKSAARGTPNTPALTPSSSKLPQKIRGVSPSLQYTPSIQAPTAQSPISSPLKRSHVLQHHKHADDLGEDDDVDMAPQVEPEAGSDETMISLDTPNPKRDIPPKSWSEFENRYATAIQELSDNEDRLIEEFQHLSDAFAIWAESSAERDNGRAWKRQVAFIHSSQGAADFVIIQEKSLEDKKLHSKLCPSDIKVVEAFKQALQLFGE
ncbi:hypothetical protein BOTNAR_0041g00150 [Botryotinia narcissicola]|uniref:Uncharacterized protein n=1 Tax=Botryotinia narcissicola TaxID=278944 RepID=A0A4Z1J1G7_9HELO|nr:hypothetical protein BOTNAR_0041g00150 [Botryotinia narcissicola]